MAGFIFREDVSYEEAEDVSYEEADADAWKFVCNTMVLVVYVWPDGSGLFRYALKPIGISDQTWWGQCEYETLMDTEEFRMKLCRMWRVQGARGRMFVLRNIRDHIIAGGWDEQPRELWDSDKDSGSSSNSASSSSSAWTP